MASREGLSTHLLIIVGNCQQCAIVQELVHLRLCEANRHQVGQEPADHAEVCLLVRAEAAGVVIGKQGFVLQKIRHQSGAMVRMLGIQVQGQRPCILSGAFQRVLRAERHVFDLTRAVPTVPAAAV
mmetsp:Transcript_1589/g.3326  ORF Transcript_1589/g.3326 Transcript_1589/m.3326 type:complete len:126 (+) Transcript_1589:2-379(+)